jgi:hypothetical protein
MFAATSVALKRPIPAFGVFIKQQKKNPELLAIKDILKRGKKLGELYRKLSPAEKKALAAEGKKGRSY